MSKQVAAFTPIPVGAQVKTSDRVSFLHLDRCVIFQDRTGIWAAMEIEGSQVRQHIQIPAGYLAVLTLGNGVSISQPAIVSLTRSGCTIIFAGAGGQMGFAQATPLSSNSKWAYAQAVLATDEKKAEAAALVLYKKQLGFDGFTGGSIKTMRGIEGRFMRDAYKKLAKKNKVVGFKRDTKADDPVNIGLNVANSILYGAAAAACTTLGLNPALGVIHRGDRRSLLYDLADLYKPSLSLPVVFAAAHEDDPLAVIRRGIRSKMHDRQVLAGMIHALQEILEPHVLAGAEKDRLVGGVDGHTNYAKTLESEGGQAA